MMDDDFDFDFDQLTKDLDELASGLDNEQFWEELEQEWGEIYPDLLGEVSQLKPPTMNKEAIAANAKREFDLAEFEAYL
jgi:hypothetical protein